MKARVPLNIYRLIDMFNRINEDCKISGEQVVPLSNVEYYTHQISNIYDIKYEKAKVQAIQMANTAPRVH